MPLYAGSNLAKALVSRTLNDVMPDDLPPKGPDYDDDFYAWTQHQAAVVREMPVTEEDRYPESVEKNHDP